MSTIERTMSRTADFMWPIVNRHLVTTRLGCDLVFCSGYQFATHRFTAGEVCVLIVNVTNRLFHLDVCSGLRTKQYLMARRTALELMMELVDLSMTEMATFIRRDRTSCVHMLAKAPIEKVVKDRLRAEVLMILDPEPFLAFVRDQYEGVA